MSLDTATTTDTDLPLTSTLAEQFAAKRRKLIDPALLPNPAKSPTQQRADGLDQDTVARYADAYRAGEPVPAIKLFIERLNGEDVYHYGDGHHRVAAARKAKLAEIDCVVEKGTARDALLYAVGSNAEHGLLRTDADKRHAVCTVLNDDEWKGWSNREIARRTRTSEGFVRTLRKELKAEVGEIKRKDGTTQKPRNAAAKKPQQQDLFDQVEPAIAERFAAVLPLLACAGSGFEQLHADKRAMIAAAYALIPAEDPNIGASRDSLRRVSTRPPDVHLAALDKLGHLEHDTTHDLWRLTPTCRQRIDDVLRTAAKALAGEKKAKVNAYITPDNDLLIDADTVLDELIDQLPDNEDYVYRRNDDGTWANATRVHFATINGRMYYAHLAQQTGTDGTYESDDALWHADIEIVDTSKDTGSYGWFGNAGITDRGYLDAFAKAVKALDLSTLSPGHRQALLAFADDLVALNLPADERPTRPTTPADVPPTRSTGPEEISPADITPAGQEIEQTDTPTVADNVEREHPGFPGGPGREVVMTPGPDGVATGVADSRPLEFRRIDKQREILQHRLLTGKPRWTGSDNEMLILALLVGVPTRRTAWIDTVKTQARDLFLEALRTELADRIRTGEAINARAWPQLPELCRLWDLDHQAIEIEAERAVPE